MEKKTYLVSMKKDHPVRSIAGIGKLVPGGEAIEVELTEEQAASESMVKRGIVVKTKSGATVKPMSLADRKKAVAVPAATAKTK